MGPGPHTLILFGLFICSFVFENKGKSSYYTYEIYTKCGKVVLYSPFVIDFSRGFLKPDSSLDTQQN